HCREHGRKLRVLWLDAHADFTTHLLAPSGHLHGMPVACLCGHGPQAPVELPLSRVLDEPGRKIDHSSRGPEADGGADPSQAQRRPSHRPCSATEGGSTEPM
ncbi:arginase family protein, partial [Ideonella sp. A 288]|uniref:arginase family protein n=1 Tax=Ideonella sp. A 288 TaxID=1962181 RepID=UPI001F2D0DF1